MRIPGRRIARRALAWSRSRLVPGPVILGYHRIANGESDPLELCVSAGNFAEQLDVLRRRYQPTALHDVSAAAAGRHAARRVAITFDDGYSDTYDTALPLLAEHEMPATVFVVSGLIGRRYWWNEVQSIVEGADELPPEIVMTVGRATFRWHPRFACGRGKIELVKKLGDWFRSIPASQHDKALEVLAHSLPGSRTEAAPVQAMSAEQVAAAAHEDGITIGSHTATHASLGHLSIAAQQFELNTSRMHLEQLTGQPVLSFSYPNGVSSAATPELARAAGYRMGCTSGEGVVNSKTNPYLLPRLWVADVGGERFAAWLSRWTG